MSWVSLLIAAHTHTHKQTHSTCEGTQTRTQQQGESGLFNLADSMCCLVVVSGLRWGIHCKLDIAKTRKCVCVCWGVEKEQLDRQKDGGGRNEEMLTAGLRGD